MIYSIIVRRKKNNFEKGKIMADVKDETKELKNEIDESTKDWWSLLELSKHNFSALVKVETGYIGGCCEGITSFLVFGAKSKHYLKEKFNKIMSLALSSSLKANPDYEGEDDKAAEEAIKQGTIKELFEDTDEIDIGYERFSLLHYGESSDMTQTMIFLSSV